MVHRSVRRSQIANLMEIPRPNLSPIPAIQLSGRRNTHPKDFTVRENPIAAPSLPKTLAIFTVGSHRICENEPEKWLKSLCQEKRVEIPEKVEKPTIKSIDKPKTACNERLDLSSV